MLNIIDKCIVCGGTMARGGKGYINLYYCSTNNSSYRESHYQINKDIWEFCKFANYELLFYDDWNGLLVAIALFNSVKNIWITQEYYCHLTYYDLDTFEKVNEFIQNFELLK